MSEQQETPAPQPVTLDNAFSVGFIAGLGFMAAQLLIGVPLWFLYSVIMAPG